ncbi:MAG: hypothetical protein AAAC47_09290 [Pararhizobium sp.]
MPLWLSAGREAWRRPLAAKLKERGGMMGTEDFAAQVIKVFLGFCHNIEHTPENLPYFNRLKLI